MRSREPKLLMEVSPVFERAWETDKRWLVMRGSTRSTKTTSICQMAIHWLLFGEIRGGQHIPKGNMAIVRKYSTTLRSTVMRDFRQWIYHYELEDYIEERKGDRQFHYGGRFVEFIGADDEQKLKGFKANITWMNEADELEWDTEVRQLRYRTSDLIIVDFNPSDPYIWIREKLEEGKLMEDGKVDLVVSTYLDNAWLTPEQIDEIEGTRDEDLEYWKVYGLGEYGKILGLVYENATIVEKMPRRLRKRGFGLDYGYRNDPTALIDCGLQNERDLFWDEYFYLTGMKTNDIHQTMEVLGVGKRTPIFADASEWRLNDELRGKGWMILDAENKPGSINYGIQLVNQYNLHITRRSLNLMKERKKYRYKTAKNGQPTNMPVDAFNHGLDGGRYHALGMLKPRRQVRTAIRGAK